MSAAPAPGMREPAFLRNLLDSASDGLLALDEEGTILEANEAAARRLGRMRRYLIGKPFAAFVPLDERRRFRTTLSTAAPEHDARLELELNGESAKLALCVMPRVAPRMFSLTILADPGAALPRAEQPDRAVTIGRLLLRLPHAVVVLRSGSRVGFANERARQLFGRDAVRVGRPFVDAVTDGELQALADRLVDKHVPVAARTIEAAHGRTLRATGISAHADEPAVLIVEDVTGEHRREQVMRDFVRNAAHQLRTPLTGIASAVDVLQAGAKEVPAERDHFLEHIEQQTARLSRIAHGLLVLARAQSGQPMRLELVELKPLLDLIAREAAPAPGVAVFCQCDAAVGALAEPDLLHEALSALVENAADHTSEGEIQLSAVDSDGRVAIDVSDTGAGLLPEHRARIFEPFYRISASVDRFGLGLAIAAQAIQAMDGTIEAVDVPAGSRFTVRLPSARVTR